MTFIIIMIVIDIIHTEARACIVITLAMIILHIIEV